MKWSHEYCYSARVWANLYRLLLYPLSLLGRHKPDSGIDIQSLIRPSFLFVAIFLFIHFAILYFGDIYVVNI